MASMNFKTLSFLFCALTAPLVAQSQTLTPAEIIEQRQALYREIGTAFKTIRDESGKPTPMKFAMQNSAKRIASALREVQPMFPAGTGSSSGVETEALDAIWTDKADFDKRYEASIVEADKLVALLKQPDMEQTRAQFKVLGNQCKGCHDKYRLEE